MYAAVFDVRIRPPYYSFFPGGPRPAVKGAVIHLWRGSETLVEKIAVFILDILGAVSYTHLTLPTNREV